MSGSRISGLKAPPPFSHFFRFRLALPFCSARTVSVNARCAPPRPVMMNFFQGQPCVSFSAESSPFPGEPLLPCPIEQTLRAPAPASPAPPLPTGTRGQHFFHGRPRLSPPPPPTTASEPERDDIACEPLRGRGRFLSLPSPDFFPPPS